MILVVILPLSAGKASYDLKLSKTSVLFQISESSEQNITLKLSESSNAIIAAILSHHSKKIKYNKMGSLSNSYCHNVGWVTLWSVF